MAEIIKKADIRRADLETMVNAAVSELAKDAAEANLAKDLAEDMARELESNRNGGSVPLRRWDTVGVVTDAVRIYLERYPRYSTPEVVFSGDGSARIRLRRP